MGSLTPAFPPARRAAQRAARLTSAALLPLALAVALLGAPAGTTSGSREPVPAGQSDLRPVASALASPTYRTFTLNILHDLGVAKARQDMVKALTLGDAGGLQEMSDAEDRQTLVELLRERDWGWYMPVDAGVAIPIIWDRQRFRMIGGHSVKVHGPEAGVTPSRFINVVRLRELATGKVFGFINTHTIAQASRDARLSDMHRIPRLRKHLRMLRAEIRGLFESTEHVFVGGDLNVNYLADRRRRNPGLPTDALGDLVSFDMPLTGSRGRTSLLDYGMTVKHEGGLRRTASEVVRGFNSDHDAVVFTYRPIDLLETGPLFNDPRGAAPDRTRVLSRQARAVRNAEAGALVRMAASRLDDPELVEALLDAHAEGVHVQVVSSAGGAALDRLAAALGTDTAGASWVQQCVDTCLGGSGRGEVDFLLVSRSGGTSELTLVGSHGPVVDSSERYTNLFRTADAGVHAAYGNVFSRLSTDATDTARERELRLGSYGVQLYPVPDRPWRDHVLNALEPVGCRNARGLYTDDGRTNVRVVVRQWSGERGQQIAARLVELARKDCDVAVVAGSKVLAGVRRTLTRGGVALRTAPVAQNLLVVDGRYGKWGGAQKAWTGGPGWTTAALGSDGATLVVSDEDAVRTYLGGFSRAWQHA